MHARLSDRRECVVLQGVEEDGLLLQEWGEDEGVASEIEHEGLAGPPSHGFDDVEGYPFEEIVERASDTEAVSLQIGHIWVRLLDRFNSFGDFLPGKGAHSAGRVSPGEEMLGRGRLVDTEVVEEGGFGIRDGNGVVWGAMGLLAFGRSLCAWERERNDGKAFMILRKRNAVAGDMFSGIKL